MLDPRAPSMKLSSVLCFVCLGRSTALRYGQPVLNRPLPCRHWPRMAIELPQYAPTIEGEICGDRTVGGQTYHEQYKEIFAHELTTSKPLRKPRPAVANDPGAKRIPFSDVRAPKASPPNHTCPHHRPTPLAGVGHTDALTLLQGPHVGVDGRGTCAAADARTLSLSLAAPRELSSSLARAPWQACSSSRSTTRWACLRPCSSSAGTASASTSCSTALRAWASPTRTTDNWRTARSSPKSARDPEP